jgi:hypothetical protein
MSSWRQPKGIGNLKEIRALNALGRVHISVADTWEALGLVNRLNR